MQFQRCHYYLVCALCVGCVGGVWVCVGVFPSLKQESNNITISHAVLKMHQYVQQNTITNNQLLRIWLMTTRLQSSMTLSTQVPTLHWTLSLEWLRNEKGNFWQAKGTLITKSQVEWLLFVIINVKASPLCICFGGLYLLLIDTHKMHLSIMISFRWVAALDLTR